MRLRADLWLRSELWLRRRAELRLCGPELRLRGLVLRFVRRLLPEAHVLHPGADQSPPCDAQLLRAELRLRSELWLRSELRLCGCPELWLRLQLS